MIYVVQWEYLIENTLEAFKRACDVGSRSLQNSGLLDYRLDGAPNAERQC